MYSSYPQGGGYPQATSQQSGFQPQQPGYPQAGYPQQQQQQGGYQQQQLGFQQQPNYQQQSTGFGQPSSFPQTPGQYANAGLTPGYQGPGNSALQPQGTGYFGSSPATQSVPSGAMQSQGTGFFLNSNPQSNQQQLHPSAMQNQNNNFYSQQQPQSQPALQSTYSQNQVLQPQATQPQMLHPQLTQSQNIPSQASQPQAMMPQNTQPQVMQSQNAQSQVVQQQNTQPQFTMPLLPQNTGFYTQQNASQGTMEPLRPTATGFVNSFANNGVNKELKIPAMRLSFITAVDQAKFETLFRSIVTAGENTVSGNDCRKIFMKSGLQPSQLARIWSLCDTSKAGKLLFPEFALAMHLINSVLHGDSIPYELDSKTKNEVNSFIDAVNISVVSDASSVSARTPFDDFISSGVGNLQPQPTGLMPQTSFGIPLQQQMTGGIRPQLTGSLMNPQITGGVMPTTFNMNPQPTGGLMQNPMAPQGTGAMMPQNTGGAVIPNGSIMAQNVGGLQAQNTGGIQSQNTGGLQPQNTGFMPPTSFGLPLQNQTNGAGMMHAQNTGGYGMMQAQNTGGYGMMQSQPTGNMPQLTFNQPIATQPTGMLPPSNFNATMPLAAQKTGFGNNEIYTTSNFDNQLGAPNYDIITPDERSLFYKIFETFDTQKRGLLDASTAVEILRKSGLNRGDLEHIWNLADINNSGQLNKQEFCVAMHLVYGRLNGRSIPNTLPPSLIPSSKQILDNVKNQLKNSTATEKKAASSVTSALSYKNNDEEEILPNFRNRRKNYPSVAELEASSNNGIESSQKTSETKSISHGSHTNNSVPKFSRGENLEAIFSIKNKIKDLLPSIQTKYSGVPDDITSRFNFILGKIPVLFDDISEVDNDLRNARIELYKLKNPPSTIGTGPGGEITEEDRRKARSKAVLKARMSALTGKGDIVESTEDDDEKLNREIAKIEEEHNKSKEMISDIKSSIVDLSASLKSSISRSPQSITAQDFEKYEFGTTMVDEVKNFIKDLKQGSVIGTSHDSIPEASMKTESAGYSKSEDRATYLKEQAQKRMKERLAKFGMNRKSSRGSLNEIAENNTTQQDINTQSPFDATASNIPQSEPIQSKSSSQLQPDDEQDGDDEEERKLQEELEKLKLQKKLEKEKRLEALRKQIDHEKSTDDFSDEIFQKIDANTNQSLQAGQRNLNDNHSALASSSMDQMPATVVEGTKQAESAQQPSRPSYFASRESSVSNFNKDAAEQQRKIQRGLQLSDDDWSDDDATKEPHRSLETSQQSASMNAYNAPMKISVKEPEKTIPLADNNGMSSFEPTIPIPLAPPLPEIKRVTNDVMEAGVNGSITNSDTQAHPPMTNNTSSTQQPAVPIAPPLPQVEIPTEFSAPIPPPPLPGIQANNMKNEDRDDSDVLSLPDSIASNDEETYNPPVGIPPPPPLPF